MWNKGGSFKCSMLLVVFVLIIWVVTSCLLGSRLVYNSESCITRPLILYLLVVDIATIVVVACIFCHYYNVQWQAFSHINFHVNHNISMVHIWNIYMRLFYRKEMEKRDSALLLSGMTLMLPSLGDTSSCTM